MKYYVYVAGPYGSEPKSNTHRALRLGTKLIEAGFIPYVPHVVAHYWHGPYNIANFMEQDLAWVAKCDVVLRMEGESIGADMEVEEAERLGIPVVWSMEALIQWRKKEEDN